MGTGGDTLDVPVVSTVSKFHRGIIGTIVRDERDRNSMDGKDLLELFNQGG